MHTKLNVFSLDMGGKKLKLLGSFHGEKGWVYNYF
jgi:hypothetical protein